MNKLIYNLISTFTNRSKTIADEKDKIREQIRELKKQLTEEQKLKDAELVFEKIESLPEFNAAKTILLYWSTSTEMSTHNIVEKWCTQKLIVLPAVKDKNLILKQYFSSETMEQGPLGIWEPDSLETFRSEE